VKREQITLLRNAPNAYGYVGHSDADYIVVKCQNHTLVVEAIVALILIHGECMLLTRTTK